MIKLLGIPFDIKFTLVVIFGTVVPMLDWYGHRITPNKSYDRFILYFVIPVILLLLFRENLGDFGLKWGNWREGLMWTVGVCLVMGVILWFLADTPEMAKYYTRVAKNRPISLILFDNMVEMFAWEFVWRGFTLFAMARLIGSGPAIAVQAIPFAFMHLGKPEFETLTTIFGGIGFGIIAWRTDSMLYPFFIHWFMVAFTMLRATGRFG